jgi:hypothetical protein
VASYPQPPGQPPQPPSGPPGGPPTGGPPSGYPAGPPGYQQPYPQQPYAQQPYAAQPYGYSPGGRRPFRRNAMLVFAQVLVIIQGCFGVLGSALVILVGIALNGAFSGVDLHNINGLNLAGAASGFLIGAGVVGLVLSTLVIIGGVRVGHPSQVARWLLAAFEILALLSAISSLAQPPRGSGSGTVTSIVLLVIAAVVLYGLIIDPATYRAFARKNLQ